MKVSILTPIYNSEKFLSQCLDSLHLQTLENAEFICINDGSNDQSLEILEKYKKIDKRFFVLNKPNTGYGDSMNQGLKLAKGEYVGVVESDDYADADMFENLYNLATRHNAQIAGSNRYLLNEQQDVYNEIMAGLPYDEVFRPLEEQKIFEPAPCIWAKIYKRQFLDANKISFLSTAGSSFQDTGFVYKSMFSANRMVLTKRAYLHYRTDNPEKSIKSAANASAIFKEFDSIDKFISKDLRKKDEFAYYSELRWQAYLWNYKRLDKKSQKTIANAMSKNIKTAQEMGFFDISTLSHSKADDIKRLIENPRKWQKKQEMRNFKKKIKNLLR